MADNMVDVYGRKLTEEQALKELADLEEQFRVTAPDSRAYNELRGEIRLLDRALENYYTQVPATTDIFGDPVETRRPDPSDFLEDPVVTRTMETGLPEDFGPPRTMRDPTPTVRGDTKTFTDAFDLFANQDDELLMTMRQDPAMEETLRMYNERAGEVRRIQRELAENPSRSVRNMLLDQLEDAKGNLASAERTLQQRVQQFNERVASAVAEPRIEDEVFGREMETQRQERQVMRGEAARRGTAQPGLSAMLESEGIPRDSFLDFMDLPENRRSGKSIPQLIEDYKIAGELPETAEFLGRSKPRFPLEGFSSDPETGLRVFTPTEVEADEDMLMRGLFADDDIMDAGAHAYDMTPGEYRERVRQQADFYDEMIKEGRTPAFPGTTQDLSRQFSVAFDDPIQRSAYEIAKQRNPGLDRLNPVERYLSTYDADARRGELRTLRRAPDAPSRKMTLERRPDSPSRMQLLRQAAEEGESLPTASDVLPTGAESRRTQGVGSRFREGQTEAAQGAVRSAAELEPDKVRMAVDRPLLRSTTGRLGFDPTIAPDPGSGRKVMPLSAKFIATAQQARDLLADPEIEAKIAPKQLSRIRELALKAAPALRAAGNAALAGELLYYSVKERSVPGGVMAAGAAAVEGAGALMGLPAALAESTIPGYGEDLEIAGTVIPKRNPNLEIAAAAGRGLQYSVGAFGREQERKRNREIYQDATEFGVRVLGLDQDSAMRRGKEYMKAYHSAIERGVEPPPINTDLGLQPMQDEALMNGMR